MKTKKILALALCAVLLVCGSVLGTMAYLTSTASVENTFTVGNVAITLDELDVDNDDNKQDNVTYGEGADAVTRDKANSYKLLPGQTYTKDPIVHVTAGSEPCYLFVKVDNGISDIEGGTTIEAQMQNNGWIAVGGVTGLYVYQNAAVTVPADKDLDVPVFATFTIKGDVSNTDLDAYNGKNITVTAYAVQAAGFGTAADAWTATFGA